MGSWHGYIWILVVLFFMAGLWRVSVLLSSLTRTRSPLSMLPNLRQVHEIEQRSTVWFLTFINYLLHISIRSTIHSTILYMAILCIYANSGPHRAKDTAIHSFHPLRYALQTYASQARGQDLWPVSFRYISFCTRCVHFAMFISLYLTANLWETSDHNHRYHQHPNNQLRRVIYMIRRDGKWWQDNYRKLRDLSREMCGDEIWDERQNRIRNRQWKEDIPSHKEGQSINLAFFIIALVWCLFFLYSVDQPLAAELRLLLPGPYYH